MFVDSLKLEMPNLFPAIQYQSFMQASRDVLLEPKHEAWTEFAGASNLIAWRFRASHEYLRSYLDSWNKTGAHASFEQIYERERDLFGMFMCGCSTIEATCYAIYALASHKALGGVSFDSPVQRRVRPATLERVLRAFPAASNLVSVLDALNRASDWATWVEFRNRMAHRSNLPRMIRASVGSAPPPMHAVQLAATSSSRSTEVSEAGLSSLFEWLVQTLARLLHGGAEFARSAASA